jgi:hypothetical protein
MSSSEVTASHGTQDQLPPSHSPQAPSLSGAPPISLLEGAHDFQMRDFINNVSVFHEVGTQRNGLETRTCTVQLDISTAFTDRAPYQSEHGWIRSQSTQP